MYRSVYSMYDRGMERLNYDHLLYFWMVAREGGVSKAAARLHLTQSTLSGQIRTLEASLGGPLFERVGRRLQLTDLGRLVLPFAEEIFKLGADLTNAVRFRPTDRPIRLTIGLADVIAKALAQRLIQPLLTPLGRVHVVVREDSSDRLLLALVAGELDILILDSAPEPREGIRIFSRLLGDSGVILMATPDLATRYRRRFPKSLDGAPFIMPGRITALRRGLEDWFERCQIQPLVVATFDDTALITVSGHAGNGIFAVPSIVEREVRAQAHVLRVGPVEGLREQIFIVSAQRQFRNPAVTMLIDHARKELFD